MGVFQLNQFKCTCNIPVAGFFELEFKKSDIVTDGNVDDQDPGYCDFHYTLVTTKCILFIYSYVA